MALALADTLLEAIEIRMADDARRGAEPGTLSSLHLPPAFVADHAVRALAYQGAMTPAEIARRWRVSDAVAVEAVESLKAGGLIELDSGQTSFERTGRVHLTAAGRERVAEARLRTWYAGALPVSLGDFVQHMQIDLHERFGVSNAEAELTKLAVDPAHAAEIAQAIHAGATLALQGAAFDEEVQIAFALGRTLEGEVSLPFALYAAGAIIRIVDPRYHHTREAHEPDEASVDILRSRESHTPWASVARPVVTLSGGVQPADVIPAYDDEARFYMAPMPLAASRGLLAVLDSAANPGALADLARLWLLPGRHHTGVLLLRSGERIEVPWRAASILFGATAALLPSGLRDALTYDIDIGELADDALVQFLTIRLPDASLFPPASVEAIARLLERRSLATRTGAATPQSISVTGLPTRAPASRSTPPHWSERLTSPAAGARTQSPEVCGRRPRTRSRRRAAPPGRARLNDRKGYRGSLPRGGSEVILHNSGRRGAGVALCELPLQFVDRDPHAALAQRPVVHALHLSHRRAVGVQLVADRATRRPNAEHRPRLDAAQLAFDRTHDILIPSERGDFGESRLDHRLDHAPEHLGHGRTHADRAASHLVRLASVQNTCFPIVCHRPNPDLHHRRPGAERGAAAVPNRARFTPSAPNLKAPGGRDARSIRPSTGSRFRRRVRDRRATACAIEPLSGTSPSSAPRCECGRCRPPANLDAAEGRLRRPGRVRRPSRCFESPPARMRLPRRGVWRTCPTAPPHPAGAGRTVRRIASRDSPRPARAARSTSSHAGRN